MGRNLHEVWRMNTIFMILFLIGSNDLCQNLKSFQSFSSYLEKNEAEKIFNKIVDEGIYNLRGPKEDGTFEFAYLSMENPQILNFSFDLEKFPFIWKQGANNIFSIKIKVPKKKNIFWGNEDAYLSELLVKLDGIEKVLDKEKLLKRGEEYEYPLNKIYNSVEVILKFQEMKDKKRSSYVEVNLYQGGLKDDPKNPDYPLLKNLLELKKYSIDSPFFAENMEKFLLNCSNSIKRELLYILYLLKGNQREQMEGVDRLEILIKQMP